MDQAHQTERTRSHVWIHSDCGLAGFQKIIRFLGVIVKGFIMFVSASNDGHGNLALVVVGVLALSAGTHGYTTEKTLSDLINFRDAMLQRGPHWRDALWSWTCPTDQATSDPNPGSQPGQACDPCGRDMVWGNWEHVACLGAPDSQKPWTYQAIGTGEVTDLHITDYKIEGSVPLNETCVFSKLRQFDFDGGWLTGSIPENFYACFPDLKEIDLSFNNLTGVLPPEIGLNKNLHEFKIEFNEVGGPIPKELGNMKNLKWMRLHVNKLNGTIPEELSQTSELLQQLTIDENELEGNLYALKDHSFTNFAAMFNPKLCGMVPIGARYAHGFNYYQTGLGLPCPDEIENGI